MGQRGLCVEINGVFYESLRYAERVTGCGYAIIKKRCLSNKFPNYKIMPFRITYTEKKCIPCGIIKPLSEFHVRTRSKDGYAPHCKSCALICANKYAQTHKKERKIYRAKYYQEHREREKIRQQKYKQSHKKETNANLRKRRKIDVNFRINDNMSRAINKYLKGMKNGTRLKDLFDWTTEELIIHLESLFTEGMSWDNYGSGKYEWSLDHIIAKSKFNITSKTCQEFKDCWALKNLQPLLRNMEKGDKPMEPKYLIKPF